MSKPLACATQQKCDSSKYKPLNDEKIKDLEDYNLYSFIMFHFKFSKTTLKDGSQQCVV